MLWTPSETPNFTRDEMACSHCGDCQMDWLFMGKLQEIRNTIGPLKITSGYRCRQHPAENGKKNPGAHAQGRAADIAVSSGKEKYKIVRAAMKMGMVGIGVSNGFVHLDSGHDYAPRPAMWNY